MQLCLGGVSKGSGKVKVKCLLEGSICLAPEGELPRRNEHVGVTRTEVTAVVQGKGTEQGGTGEEANRAPWRVVGGRAASILWGGGK